MPLPASVLTAFCEEALMHVVFDLGTCVEPKKTRSPVRACKGVKTKKKALGKGCFERQPTFTSHLAPFSHTVHLHKATLPGRDVFEA